jgi:uncharacterized membrane protein
MNGVPLHPMIVHFPMVLTILLPMFALGALWAIRRGVHPRPAWAVPLVLAAALSASAFVALRTGEAEEDRVEQVVPENAIHDHEEAAELFLKLSGVLLLITAAGLLGGRAGTTARFASTFGAIALVLAGVQVGKKGGELVYVHGAGQAYADPAAVADGPGEPGDRGGESDD